jgi:serine/threonine protein kinase
MKGSMDYWLAQSLSLVFYIITLVIYNRARKEYVGGKIGAAIKLIMVFLAVLFLSDFVDYFFILILPLGQDTILILKILLKLIAIGVLFFGGLRFFMREPAATAKIRQPVPLKKAAAEPAQPPLPAPEPSVDTTLEPEDVAQTLPALGRYEILEQIGKGAMGIVYKGRDPKLQRLTAIKTIRFIDDFDEDQVDEIKKQFYREAEVVAKLSHPNIVTVYDVGEDLDLSYLAMEYLEGESLEKYTKEGNLLPIRKCIDIIKQVCDALAYAHNHGIVHRDIKPANIMLLRDGQVKVTDFGIARVSTSSRTRTGIVKGTPYYMSPEQTKGLKITGPSDIFSLGVVFYQLLTGRLPFTGDNLAAIMYQTTMVDPDPPTTFNPKIDAATVAILNRALEKGLDERYQTAKQMGSHLRLLGQKLDADKPVEVEVEDAIDFQTEDVPFEPASEIEMGSEPELDFSDLEHALYTEDTYETSKPHLPEDQPDQQEDLDLSDLKKPEEINKKAKEFSDLMLQGEAQFFEVETGEELPGPEEELSLAEKAKPKRKASVWTKLQGLATPKTEVISKYKLPIAISCALILIVATSLYYFWQRSRIHDTKIPHQSKKSPQVHNIKEIQKKQEQERLARIQQQKEQERLAKLEKEKEKARLAKIEAEKKKEQERLAKIEAEKKKEQERLAKIEAEKKKEQERLAKIAAEKKKEQERLAKIESARIDALKLKQMNKIDRLLVSAEDSLKLKNYLDSKNNYDTALKMVEDSIFKDDKIFIKYKKQIEDALKNEDIVYGSKGYIKFREEWVTPDKREKILYQEDFIKYKGNFIKYLELKNIIKQLTYPKVQSFLTSKYSGQSVHKKQITFQKITLNENTALSSHFTVVYRWEVWTFTELGEGSCSLGISYSPKKDDWEITKGCE